MKQTDDWDDLAVRAQQGDKQAYHQLLTAIVPYIRNIIAPGLANEHWLDDLLQDILMGVHKSLARYMPGQPFKPWLNAIIRYRRAELLTQYYKSQGHMSTSLEEVEELGVEIFDALHELGDVERVLQQLPENQQKIFRLARVEGYSIKEIADKTGMSVSAVKVSIHRSAAKIKLLLDEINTDKSK